MKLVSPLRFDALAGYVRDPRFFFVGEDVGYFEEGNERVLGVLVRDQIDNDYGGVVLARDRSLKFRCVDMIEFLEDRGRAEAELGKKLKEVAELPDEEYFQRDEVGKPVDFFTPVVPAERLNPHFVRLRDEETFSAARGIIEQMMRWYDDVDGNFIEQFQTTGFDARIWELYLFAVFREMLFALDRTHAAPDFLCVNPLARFYVEAVTVSPTRDAAGAIVPPPAIRTPEELKAYRQHYMPIKFAGPLTSKLGRRYWDLGHVGDSPLLFAIQDFSAPQSMIRSRSAFEAYVTGYRHTAERDANGKLKIVPHKIDAHRWGKKVVQSGFFTLPDAEHVSAVLFSNSGTISKFNRMGLLAGFGSPRLRLWRAGLAVNHDPNSTTPIPFRHSVNDPAYRESWSEGMDLWHNPTALHPLDPDALPLAAQHRLLADGQVTSNVPQWHPLVSRTIQTLASKPTE